LVSTIKIFVRRSEKCKDKAKKDEKPEFTYVNEDFESFFNAVIVLRSSLANIFHVFEVIGSSD
jgi:hypothetical protein